MKTFVEQFFNVYKTLPISKKVTMGVVLMLVISGFIIMFFWANRIDYQLLYGNLAQEDAADIITKLKEQRVPYKISSGGTEILVPEENVHELRLSLAKEGIPTGGNVGYEIFDKTNFSTTEFVQKLNYQRALQGELVRTINDFREVENARVLLALPEESLFVKDSKPPTASVLVKLKSPLSPDKIMGIVHLVSSAVEGLKPDNVTVVDTAGNVLYKGGKEETESALLATNKLDYQKEVEGRITEQIQTMLEGIVGKGKAIVRVNADIDFDQIDLSEEKYDPESSVVRSKQKRLESAVQNGDKNTAARIENTTMGAVPVQALSEGTSQEQKEDEVVNYEINRFTRRVIKPSGSIKRLSVAAAIDGKYENVNGDNGIIKKYIPRSAEELQEYEKIVKRAMGFNSEREDQVYISSFPLSDSYQFTFEKEQFDWKNWLKENTKPIVNIALVFIVFLFVVRPLLKSMKNIAKNDSETRQITIKEKVEEDEKRKLPELSQELSMREKTLSIARDNPERTEQLIRSWLQGEH